MLFTSHHPLSGQFVVQRCVHAAGVCKLSGSSKVHLSGCCVREKRTKLQLSQRHSRRSLSAGPSGVICQAALQPDGKLEVDVSSLSDGPDLFVFRNANNLGAIQDSLKGQPNEADIKAMQEVPNRGTVFEGIYIDGPAIFGSSVLLVVLLLLMFNQVFGLDKLIGAAKAKRAEAKADKEKWSIYNARQQLERSMSSFDDSDERQS